MNHRLTVTAALASAAASTGLFPLVTGGKWFWGGLGAIILIAVIGTATRLRAVRALPAAVCLLASLVGMLLYLNLVYSAKSSFLHVLPTSASLTQLWQLGVQGIQDTQRYASPVPPVRGIVLLATAGIGLVAALTDLVAVRLRRSALAGLPLLVLFSIPVATGAGKDTLADGVVFCLGMAGYLALLSADGQERLRLWGRLVTPWNSGRNEAAEELGSGPSTRALAASGRRIGLAAVALALFVPLLVPSLHAQKLFASHHGPGLGTGPGGGQALDPLVQMNRQLQEAKPTTVLTYRTTDQFPQYLQMFVLGTLNDSSWIMSPGRRPAETSGTLPSVPGLGPGRWSREQTTIQIRPGVLTADTFLPAPYSPRQLSSPGSWLVDPGTLMLYSDSQSVSGLHYSVTSLDVSPPSDQLDQAPAGAGPMGAYLDVPQPYRSLAGYAKRVVGNAATPAAKARALAHWFTTTGGFKYSLNVSGSGGAAGVRNFLLRTKTGYCQQFAFAMAVLARLLGIPSRVVVGYTAGSPEGGGNWVVKTSDAHAWPELYFRGFGWLRMEPTPRGSARGQGTANAPAYAIPPASGTGTGTGNLGNSGSSKPHSGTNRLHAAAGGGLARKGAGANGAAGGFAPVRGHGGGGLGVLLIVLAALLAAALITPRATRSLIRRRRWLTAHDDRGRAHAAWHELLDDLADNGIPHPPGETPRAVAKRVTAQLRLAEPDHAALLRIAQAEERASYAREPWPAGTLAADVVAVRDTISAAVTKSARWRARLLPASAVERTRQSLSHALDVFAWLEVATARLRRRLPRPRTTGQS